MCTGNPYKSDPCVSTSVYVWGGHWTSIAVAYLDTYRRNCAASKKTGLQLLTSVLELFFCFDLCCSKDQPTFTLNICLFYCKCHNHVTNILSLQVPTNLSEAYIAYYKVDNQTMRNLQAIQH